jgi:prepilin-type N-terminal cleavage/methylation domain-containing protein
MHSKNIKYLSNGFTIVEMAVAIAVIGILATITTIAMGNWQQNTAKSTVKSDLTSVYAAMESARNFNNAYPSTLPSTFRPSSGVVLEMTSAAAGTFCINGYSTKYGTIRMSVASGSSANINNYLCNDPSNGSVSGGTIPSAPKGVNVAPSFSSWTLSGGATYNSSTGELTLGANGQAVSPKMKVNGVAGMNLNGQFFATTQSPYASFQPNGGWLSGASYFAADGTTPSNNTINYSSNGCAGRVTLGSWNASLSGDCGYQLGNSIEYANITLTGTSGGYASSDLKIKNPTVILY